MAGPSIVVRVLGDLKQLGSSMDGAGSKAQSTASRAHSAFSNMLGTLNRSGVLGPFAGAFDALDATIGAVTDHAKGVGQAMMGVGGGVLALGATLSAFGSKEQASHQQLQASIKATGHDYEDYASNIEKAVKQQENYGHTSAQTQDALSKLTQATHDPAKAIELLGTASNVAAAKHEDLTTAATQVGRVYNGNTKLLKEFGVTIDKATGLTKDGKTATQALADVTKGQAAAATDTFAGKLDKIKTKLEDQVSMFGQKYGPTLQIAGTAIMALGTIWEVVGPMMAAGELAALGPILLVIAGLAALGVAVYVVYRNWDTIWKAMHAAVMFVWEWIKNNWPLLVGILFGPVGIAVALIVTHFNMVKAAAKAAFDFIVAVWNQIVGFFAAIGGAISGALGAAWGAIVGAAQAAVGAVAGAWNSLVGAITGVGAAIGRAAHGMFDPLLSAFKAVVNGISSAWNSTVGSLHVDIPGWVPGIGGHGFDAPRIPSLAQGGLITQTGFVYAHAGEAISPIPTRSGPAINVEHLTLSDEIDIDTFMRRAAWVARTQTL